MSKEKVCDICGKPFEDGCGIILCVIYSSLCDIEQEPVDPYVISFPEDKNFAHPQCVVDYMVKKALKSAEYKVD